MLRQLDRLRERDELVTLALGQFIRPLQLDEPCLIRPRHRDRQDRLGLADQLDHGAVETTALDRLELEFTLCGGWQFDLPAPAVDVVQNGLIGTQRADTHIALAISIDHVE